MKFSKITVLLMVFIMLFVFSACGEKNVNPLEGYEKSECTLSFSDDNLSNVNLKPTFKASSYGYAAKAEDLSVYQTFGSGMCIQRDACNRIYGITTAEKIAVAINGKTYYGSVSDGEWEVWLPKMNAGGPYEMNIISDKGRLTLTDVYIGEVFLLSGQSNMEWRLNWSGSVMADIVADAAACKNEKIRLLDVEANPQRQETKVLKSELKWDFARAASIRTFSAVGYLYGKRMQEQLGCPIGLISTAVGGSILEYWLDNTTYTELRKQVNVVTDSNNQLFTPSLGWNGIIYPLLGYNVRGVLWYQGCSNTLGTEAKYDIGLKMLINKWREAFENPQLSFVLFELARFNEKPYAYSIINERITETAKEMDNVEVVLNLDLGDWNNIHPQDKRQIASRAADVALRAFYGKQTAAAPEIESFEAVDGKTVKIHTSQEVVLKNGSNGFEVYTDSGYTFECTVTAAGKTITVSCKKEFSKIRYGYVFPVTGEIKNDVSKSVTVYSIESGLPLNLFILDVV